MKKILMVLVILFLTVGCSNKKYYSTNLFYMDTIINIKIYNVSESKANEAFKGIEDIYNYYQKLTNYYDENSELYQFNHGKKDINNDLKTIIDFGLDWYNKSNNLLNINIGGLTKIWHNFREQSSSFPTTEQLNEINIKISDDFYNSNNINVDLGAISKGYATELAGRYLEDNGIDYYIINAGGNVLVGKSNKGYYNIGITSPIETSETFYIVKGENISVVTSGSYERFYEYNGEKYHHIINPDTRYPANIMKSVTVIGKNSSECDALSTTLFLMDIESGKKFIKDYDVDVIWYTNDNQIIKNEGFRYE